MLQAEFSLPLREGLQRGVETVVEIFFVRNPKFSDLSLQTLHALADFGQLHGMKLSHEIGERQSETSDAISD